MNKKLLIATVHNQFIKPVKKNQLIKLEIVINYQSFAKHPKKRCPWLMEGGVNIQMKYGRQTLYFLDRLAQSLDFTRQAFKFFQLWLLFS